MSFGIDFGTTNSVLAHWDGEDVEVVSMEAGNLDDWSYPGFDELFPSYVGASSTRPRLLFGWEAKLRSELSVPAAKRLLGGDAMIPIANREWPASTVSAGILHTIRERASTEQLLDVDKAVVTVPANSAGAARYRTRAAAREAGIRVDSLINEPTAAAVYYKYLIREEGPERILTFDWGGGTIDVTVLEAVDGVFEEQTSRGVAKLGGLEVDARLAKLVLGRIKQGPQTPAEEAAFARDIELAKIRLSSEDIVTIPTPDRGSNARVSRGELENAIADVVQSAIEPLRACLDDLRITPEDIDAVLMIGGSSQIPLVRSMVGDIMGDRLVSDDVCDSLTSVARGAAIAAAVIDGEIDIDLAVTTTHALGTASTRKTKSERVRTFSEIIPRNASLPRIEHKHYTPNSENQRRINLEIWEGNPDDPVAREPDADNDGNVCLTELAIDLPRTAGSQDSGFTLTYEYDVSGILRVKAVADHGGTVLIDKEINAFGLSSTGVGVSRKSLHDFLEFAPDLGSRAFRTTDDDGVVLNQEHSPGAAPPMRVPAADPGQDTAPSPAEVAARTRPKAEAETPASPHQDSDVVVQPANFVIDGSNIAWGNGNRAMGGRPSYARLKSAVAALRKKYPNADAHVVVDANFRHLVPEDEYAEVDRAIAEGEIHRVPAGTVGGADVFILDVAQAKGATIVSNGGFRQHEEYHQWLLGDSRLFGAQEIADVWVFRERRPAAARSEQ
ncbi:molecular chaperone DnaK (HSP70) [Spinactinospora alkalitolerans]|uniref:Molecular chaperone DnaK (HSP70) n=1 Tax=Spinactinospora alkalitolerans TaxID=687207 RepID=A0A852TPY8_9ACTN|nr:Hsp70 family protein [Spinactinospora alkalitolerans]NYE46028.1 molecular chaperone DnaK (HSP70) [Spinactinospora alkalitolerans]